MAQEHHIDVVKSLSGTMARKILLFLCKENATCQRTVELAETLIARKRKSAICVQCEKIFERGKNGPEACLYHPGKTEPDYESDFWADHEEDCHGDIDTPQMRIQVPDGFEWNCCGRLGSESGCTPGYHESNPAKSMSTA